MCYEVCLCDELCSPYKSLKPGWGDKICIWEAVRGMSQHIQLGADCVVLIMGGQRNGVCGEGCRSVKFSVAGAMWASPKDG